MELHAISETKAKIKKLEEYEVIFRPYFKK